MKKFLVLAALLGTFAACQQKPADTATTPADASASNQGTFPIAFVNVDSVMSNYKYAKVLAGKFETQGRAKQDELKSKAERFQGRAIDFQQKVQQHLITSVQAEKLQKDLMQEEQTLGALQQKMQQEMAFQEREMLLTLNDSLKAALGTLNKDGKYKMVLRNSMMTENVIVSTPDADLTAQVIELLNQRYQAASKDSAQ